MKLQSKTIRLAVGIVAVLTIAFAHDRLPFAQEPPVIPPSKVERKNRAPVSNEILKVKVAHPIEAKLRNGLTVLIIEDHRFPAVTAQLYLRSAGALFEPAESPGLANVTADMLKEGTRGRTSQQIAQEIDRLGATLGASSSFGSPDVVVSASGLSDNFDAWFSLMAEVLLHPTFPASELAKFKQRYKVQLRQQRSSAGFLAEERFARAVFGSHPAAIVAPTPEALDALTSEALMKWHRERYVPQNAILAVAGDVRSAELLPKLESMLGSWRQNGLAPRLPPDPAALSLRKIYLVDRPASVQTTVVLGNIAIGRRSDDYMSMVVMNYVLGGGAAGRLFLNLREEKGYTYGAYSGFTAVQYPGPWRAGGNVRTEVTEGALKEFFYEISRMREEKVGESELAAAKRSVVAGFALSLEDPASVLGFAITRKIYNLPEDYWDTYPSRIMAVTADDVQRVARKYLTPEALQLVAVGDGGKIKSVLEKYGAVTVYDSAGNPLTAQP